MNLNPGFGRGFLLPLLRDCILQFVDGSWLSWERSGTLKSHGAAKKQKARHIAKA